MINHIVVFWLKPDCIEEGRAKLLQAARSELGLIDGVRNLGAGSPIPTDRKVVDTSYQVALTMQFENDAALQAYQSHPVHQKFLKECVQPFVDRILVYDFS